MDAFLQQTVNGLALGGVYALYATGFSLVLGNLKVFHLAHAAVFTWGAIFGYILIGEKGLSIWLALPIVAVLAGLLNVIAYGLLIRHIEGRPNKELAGFLSSLGGFIVLTQLAVLYLDHKTVRLPVDAFPTRTWTVGQVTVSSIQLTIFLLALAAFILLRGVLTSTELGREIRAVADDREASAMLGVDVDRISAIVFFLSGGLAGIGAVLVSVAFNIIDAALGSTYLIIAIAVMVLGGVGNMAGVFIGALAIGLTSAYTVGFLTSSYRDVVVFGILLLFFMFRPTGLFAGPGREQRV